jgi:hypothetical protein
VKPLWWLRAAALVSLLLGLGHGRGHPWIPTHDPQIMAVVEAMQTHALAVTGLQRSLFDFYVGFGWMLDVFLLAQALLLWQIGTLAKAGTAGLRPLVAILLLANLANTALEACYLFWVPVILSALVSLFLSVALLRLATGRAAQTA